MLAACIACENDVRVVERLETAFTEDGLALFDLLDWNLFADRALERYERVALRFDNERSNLGCQLVYSRDVNPIPLFSDQ